MPASDQTLWPLASIRAKPCIEPDKLRAAMTNWPSGVRLSMVGAPMPALSHQIQPGLPSALNWRTVPIMPAGQTPSPSTWARY